MFMIYLLGDFGLDNYVVGKDRVDYLYSCYDDNIDQALVLYRYYKVDNYCQLLVFQVVTFVEVDIDELK